MKRWSVIVLIIGLTLAACQAAPEPTADTTTEPTVESAATAESLTPPTPTSAPTFTPVLPTLVPSATPTPASTATPVPNDVWVASVDGLNMRASANVTATLVTTLKDKQHLIAVASPIGPDAGGITWQNVRADDGQSGFVSTAFLTTTNPAGPAATLAPTASVAATATVAAPSPAVTSTVPANVTGEVYVTAVNGLNLRSQANTTSNVVTIVAYAQHLTALGSPIGPDAAGIKWQAVRTDDGKTGYVSAEFISTTKPEQTPTPTATVTSTAPITLTATPTVTAPVTPTTSDVWVIATGGLFLRAQPNTTGGVVAALNYGQHLTALSAPTAPDASGIIWQNVRTDANQTGYAAADFLSTTPPVTATSTITATATPTTTTQSESPAVSANVVMAANPGGGGSVTELFQRINALRAERGLNQLAWNDELAAAALRHSEDMAATGRVSHTGSDGTLEQQRIAATGYAASISDEVIYASVNGIEPVWGFWSTHPIHLYVLTNARYTDIGISAYTAGGATYYTADFGAP